MFPYLSFGPFSLPIPELSLIIGFWLGTVLIDHELKKSNIDQRLVDNLLWILLLSGLLGARLSYIARNISAFQGNLKAILSLNPALLDPAGGFLIALTSGYIFLSKNQISYWKILDGLVFVLSPILISLSFAKFASGKDYGLPTNLPWGITLWGEIRHPVQLYFIAAGIAVLLIIRFIYHQRNHIPGYTFLIFLSLTSGSYLFLNRFLLPHIYLPGGYRLYQVLFWMVLTISLALRIFLEKSFSQENSNGS
jgi:phosphatidylglycerol:prolipoprotein diacylglycerol transferase